MVREHIDSRAVIIGAISGASVVAVPLLLAGELLVDPYNMLAAIISVCLIAGGVSGTVTGYTSQFAMKPMHEGTIAATVGICLGITLWISGRAFVSPLHPADTGLILFFNVFMPLFIVFPFALVLGAFAAEKALYVKSEN